MSKTGQKMPSVEELRRLYHEEGLTPKQIADRCGLSSTSGIMPLIKYGYRIAPSGTVTDPTATLPKEVLDNLPAGSIKAWRKNKVCLCGCGTPVGLRTTDNPYGKRGEPSFFKPGHDGRFIKRYRGGWNHTPATRERMRQAMYKHSVDSSILGELSYNYRQQHGLTARQAGLLWGVNGSVLIEVEAGTRPRVRKTTAVKILKGVGEPIPDHLLDTKPEKPFEFRHPQGSVLGVTHMLYCEGRAYQDPWGNLLYGRSSMEPGVAKCSCGAKSPVYESDRQRRKWHRDHREEQLGKAS